MTAIMAPRAGGQASFLGVVLQLHYQRLDESLRGLLQ